MYLTYLFQRSHEGVPLPATAPATAENSITAVASSDSYAATASVKVPPAAPSVPEVVYTVGPPVSTAAPSPAALMPTPTPLQRQGSARSINGAEGQTNTLPPAPPVGDNPQMSSPYAVPPFSPGGGGGGGAVESFTMLPRQRSVKVESNVPRYMQPKRANSTMSSSMSVGGLSGSNMMNSNGGGTTPR